MKRLLLVFLLVAAPAAAQIPLNEVIVLGSPARVLAFPAVATIDRLGLVPGALHLEVSHTTPWPAVSIDGGDPVQAATLWVFLRIGGRWYATGAERLRPGQINGDPKPEDADVNNFIGVSWLYDAGRWGVMAGYTPRNGEQVGMMVAAGSSRSDDQAPVQERTKIIQFAWPGSAGSSRIIPTWTEGSVGPPPVDPPFPPPDPPVVDLGPILRRLEALEARLGVAEGKIGSLESRPVYTMCSASVNLGFARVPVANCVLR